MNALLAALIRSQQPAAAATAMFRNHDVSPGATIRAGKRRPVKPDRTKLWQFAVLRA